MPKIHFIEANNTEHIIEASVGRSVMQAAVDHSLPGIVGECGGCCSCASCHGYIDEEWIVKLAPPSGEEKTMLESALSVRQNSRLTCQIIVSSDLDGLIVRLPENQY